jgi:hypothetical protein
MMIMMMIYMQAPCVSTALNPSKNLQRRRYDEIFRHIRKIGGSEVKGHSSEWAKADLKDDKKDSENLLGVSCSVG